MRRWIDVRKDPAEAPVVATCAWCRGEIYAGCEVARIDDGGGFVHAGWRERCADEYAAERVYDAVGVIDRDCNVE